MSPDPEMVLEQLRAICLALPETAERLSHGSPGFHIDGGKFFAYFWHNHHGDGITALLVKTSGLDEQTMLIEADPDTYYKPPYLVPPDGSASASTGRKRTGISSPTGWQSAGNSSPQGGC